METNVEKENLRQAIIDDVRILGRAVAEYEASCRGPEWMPKISIDQIAEGKLPERKSFGQHHKAEHAERAVNLASARVLLVDRLAKAMELGGEKLLFEAICVNENEHMYIPPYSWQDFDYIIDGIPDEMVADNSQIGSRAYTIFIDRFKKEEDELGMLVFESDENKKRIVRQISFLAAAVKMLGEKGGPKITEEKQKLLSDYRDKFSF